MKKRILALALATVTALSLVACGGNSTETSTGNTNTENETTNDGNTIVDQNAWESMSFSVDGVTITIPSTRREYPLNQENPDYGPWKIHIMGNVKNPNYYHSTVGEDNCFFVHSSEDTTVYDKSNCDLFKIGIYYPTDDASTLDCPIYSISVAYKWSVLSALAKGEEVDVPNIELPNGLVVGQYLQNNCPEIIAAYGEPDEITTSKVVNGLVYVYISDDGNKTFKLYTESSRLIGFHMSIDTSTYDWYRGL